MQPLDGARSMDGQALASAICIGVGGSVGREGPIVQIGSSLASSIGQWVKMPEKPAAHPGRLRGGRRDRRDVQRADHRGVLRRRDHSAGVLHRRAVHRDAVGHDRGCDRDPVPGRRHDLHHQTAAPWHRHRPGHALARPAGPQGGRRDAAFPAAVPGETRCQRCEPCGRRSSASLPGPVTSERDPQAIFATESLAQTLRQLEVYGRDGLPVLSDDGQQIAGWVTNASWPAATCPRPENPALRARASR